MDLSDLSALMGETTGGAMFADVWVLALEAGLSQSETRLIGEARRLADGLGCYVQVVMADEDGAAKAIALGADRVHLTADAAAYVAAQAPEFVLLPAGGEALAARLAHGFGAGLITRAQAIAIDPETRALRGEHPVYGGDYRLALEIVTPVKVVTLDPTALSEPMAQAEREGEIYRSDLPTPPAAVRDLGPADDFTPPAWRPLSKACTIVAVGRGMGDREGVALARQLAERLEAEFAGDRSARDAGWVDAAQEVGVTAQEVAPELYVALGILGDTIHNAAIEGARKVVAVHPNPDAPIFAAADAGLVGDVKEALQAILASLDDKGHNP